jgi:hypothetical protein
VSGLIGNFLSEHIGLGDVMPLDKNTGYCPIFIVHRLVDQIYMALLERATRNALQLNWHRSAYEWLSGGIDPIKDVDKALRDDLRQHTS